MAIFRRYTPIPYNRAGEDRKRHIELVKKSIKNNLVDVLLQEDISIQKENRKIKVPIKAIKEYEFIYSHKRSFIAAGEGNEKKGQRIELNGAWQEGAGMGAGQLEGEDIFETEITMEEIFQSIFDDLELPNLKEKKFKKILNNNLKKKKGFKRYGIFPRLSKRRTAIEKIKRKQATKKILRRDIIERFPFKKEDLRYSKVKFRKNKEYNAVIIFIMDTSASMDQMKKYMARSFFFMIYKFIKMKYEEVDICFISHSTIAKEVTEEEFFHKVESGGTYISSGYKKALEIINSKYNPQIYNIYIFHASDGDNWSEDNDRAVKVAKELSDICNLFGYIEIMGYGYSNGIRNKYLKEIEKENFIPLNIEKKEDLWKVLKHILKQEIRGSEGGT
ncbi:MAG: sporulation protein YhbH [Clostridium cochlearium]|uniref:sporulation protein YhbH n=1 Tax=Clostridium cochlearium TaxID=1494 RepID=UPI00280BDAE4|nr:sporulation protein YhbH [Clostridium cochlearium]MDU1442470.1 sporulation protein YhbH [Clostridium cochlearium]